MMKHIKDFTPWNKIFLGFFFCVNLTLFFAFSSGLFEWVMLIRVWFERFLLPNTSSEGGAGVSKT